MVKTPLGKESLQVFRKIYYGTSFVLDLYKRLVRWLVVEL